MRTRMIAGNLAAVLIVGLVSYGMVKSSLEAELLEEVDSRITSDFRLLDRSFRLSARELAELVDDRAAAREMADIFVSSLDESSRRTRAYEAAERTAAWLADPSRRGGLPDIVVIIDDTGRVVARNADRNRMYQQDLTREVPVVRSALVGESKTGIWRKEDENKVLQVAASPIRSEGRVVGALLVGYDLSNGLARAEGALLGRDVAFVLEDRVYSSSFEQGAASEALRGFLVGNAGRPAMTAALEQGVLSSPFEVQLGRDEYVGVIGPAPAASSEIRLAMVVLANRSAQIAKAASTNVILIMMVLGALAVIVYGFLLGNSFLRPIEQMEDGILAVINGRTDLRLDIESAELGGLAYRINQLLNIFTGTPEEDEQGLGSRSPGERWQDESVGQNSAGDGGGPATADASAARAGGEGEADDPELVARLAAEPEEQYYARVYREYVAAKRAVGEDVSNIPKDKFVQRLKANEQSLMNKHGCRMVRFQVQTVGTQVNLKPVLIR